jgi:hypothetical protein
MSKNNCCGHNRLVHTLDILLLHSSRSHMDWCHWVTKNNVRIIIILKKMVHTLGNNSYYYWGMLLSHLVRQNKINRSCGQSKWSLTLYILRNSQSRRLGFRWVTRTTVNSTAPSSEKAHTLDNNNRCRYRKAFVHLIQGIQVKKTIVAALIDWYIRWTYCRCTAAGVAWMGATGSRKVSESSSF